MMFLCSTIRNYWNLIFKTPKQCDDNVFITLITHQTKLDFFQVWILQGSHLILSQLNIFMKMMKHLKMIFKKVTLSVDSKTSLIIFHTSVFFQHHTMWCKEYLWLITVSQIILMSDRFFSPFFFNQWGSSNKHHVIIFQPMRVQGLESHDLWLYSAVIIVPAGEYKSSMF